MQVVKYLWTSRDLREHVPRVKILILTWGRGRLYVLYWSQNGAIIGQQQHVQHKTYRYLYQYNKVEKYYLRIFIHIDILYINKCAKVEQVSGVPVSFEAVVDGWWKESRGAKEQMSHCFCLDGFFKTELGWSVWLITQHQINDRDMLIWLLQREGNAACKTRRVKSCKLTGKNEGLRIYYVAHQWRKTKLHTMSLKRACHEMWRIVFKMQMFGEFVWEDVWKWHQRHKHHPTLSSLSPPNNRITLHSLSSQGVGTPTSKEPHLAVKRGGVIVWPRPLEVAIRICFFDLISFLSGAFFIYSYSHNVRNLQLHISGRTNEFFFFSFFFLI